MPRGRYLMNRFFFAVVVSALAGCATPPTQQEISSADYGPEPSNYQAVIKDYMASALKDPESARYEFYRKTTEKGFSGNPRTYGWVTCFNVNAKNSYGGYTGMQKYFVLIRHNVVVTALSGDGRGGFADEVVWRACAGLSVESDETGTGQSPSEKT